MEVFGAENAVEGEVLPVVTCYGLRPTVVLRELLYKHALS